MPYKRKYKKRKSFRRQPRKRGRRRRRRGAMTYSKIRTIGLPDQTYVKLRYHTILNEGAIAEATHIFSMNSLFDPDVTGIGSQPMGFDQWKNFYTHYQVLGSSIKVIALNAALSNAVVCVRPANTSVPVLINSAIELPYSRYRWMGNQNGQNRTIIKNYMSVKKMEARNTNSINFTAPITASPSSQKFWHVSFASNDRVSAVAMDLDVLITYYVKFFRRTQLPSS